MGRSRLLYVIWNQLFRPVAALGRLCRLNIQRRQTGRSADTTAHHVRDSHQPENRQDATYPDSAIYPAACRPGDRVITRRNVVLALGAGALGPLASFAQQQGKIWRIGYLSQRHVDFVDSDLVYAAFMQGLRELGYIEGKNLLVEWRSAEGNSARLPELAVELVRLQFDVLVTSSTPGAFALQKATSSIPIVMITVADPVGTGLVKSLARPGGNSTALSVMTAELNPKRLELLRGMVPKVTRVAVLVNPSNVGNMAGLKTIQDAAPKVGVTIHAVEARTPGDIANAFAIMTRQNIEALVVTLESLFQQQRGQIVELAMKQRLPTIGAYAGFAESGGLMSYGQSLWESHRRAANYIDKIFKGANPGDLPVEQPTKFELFINMKTASTLGIRVPQTILVQATKVIE